MRRDASLRAPSLWVWSESTVTAHEETHSPPATWTLVGDGKHTRAANLASEQVRSAAACQRTVL